MKRNIVKLMTFCLLLTVMLLHTSKVDADSFVNIDTKVTNVTNPGGVVSEHDVMQVVVTITPGAGDLSKLAYHVSQDNYRIDQTTIAFSGTMNSSVEEANGRYSFNLQNLQANTEYTLTYTIRFTGTITDKPVTILPQQGSYEGRVVGGAIFGGRMDIVVGGGGGTTVYSIPEKNIKKTATNTTTRDGKHRVGDSVQYEIELTNTSATASLWDRIMVSDYVPEEMLVDMASIAVDGRAVINYTVDSNGDIRIPLNDLANGNSTTITLNANILDSAYGKTIVNTAEVDGLQASDVGLYVEEKVVINNPEVHPSIDVPPTNEGSSSETNNLATNEKTTRMNPSTANPSANTTANGSVSTMDTTNAGILYVLLTAAVAVMYTKRKKLQE